MNRNKPEENRSRIRCAIYTRKSTEERLDLEFNSLDAQREAAESFIASQKSEGWICLPKRYDDAGFSGGNLDRPAYRRQRIRTPSAKCAEGHQCFLLPRA